MFLEKVHVLHLKTTGSGQEAFDLHLLVPVARGVGGTSQVIKNSSSQGVPTNPFVPPFCYVTASQGLQEALGPHLLVPDASRVGQIKM